MNDPNASKPDPRDVSTETQDARIVRAVTIPDRIGPYKILERIGEGGMGIVYVAEQRAPVRRRVALKVIKLGMDTKQVLARFEVEHHALAIMNHPNIARVYDAGATAEGRPYFVMEHVAGIPINDYCDRNRLPTRQRLDLFMQVCHGVQHAHQKGVIHRDLKPSNILVMMQDSKPVPKIIDFGVAKATAQPLTERTLYTELGQLVGTPEYMSPEQAEMTAIDIDTRSDIYSLGAILYELLVGALPFDRKTLRKAGYAEIQRIIREVDPPKPSTRLSSLGNEPEPQASVCANVEGAEIARTAETEPQASAYANVDRPRIARASPGANIEQRKIAQAKARGSGDDIARRRRTDLTSLIKQLRGDLDWITMKAMDKDRTRRYATAAEFADDIGRHLKHEPVAASPPGAGYRFRKLIRRNRGVVAASAVVFIVLVAGVIGTTSQAIIATHQRKLAEQRADELKTVTEFQQSMLGAIDAETMGRGIFANIREGIREGLQSDGANLEHVEATLASFDALIGGVNATNVALEVVDENVLGRAVETIDEKFADQPQIRAALRQTVADTYKEIGLYEQAMPLQEACLRTRRRVLGDDHPSTLESINGMGFLLYSMGKYTEAEPYIREALDGRRRILNYDHPDTLESINTMGFLLDSIGKHAEAEPYYREVLEGRRRVLGDDHPRTLESINNMGFLLDLMGKYAEAEPYFREGLHGNRRILGDDHPSTLESINNMGILLVRIGKYAEAEPYFSEALDGRRRVLGDDHPSTLESINGMGFLLYSMGKYAEVEPYLREALDGRRRVLGDDHLRTLISISNLGKLLVQIGKSAEGERLAREAADRGRAALGETHWLLGNILDKQGFALTSLGRYVEAEKVMLEGHGVLVAALGDEHAHTKSVIGHLVALYESWDAAEPGKGYDEKAAEWRKKLPEDNGE